MQHTAAHLYYADAAMIYDDKVEFEPARLARLMDALSELKQSLRELND